MINYFEVLSVSENAEPEVIKASYRALAKKYHPDSYTGTKEEAERKMALINEAYQTLSDDHLRRQYIEKLNAIRNTNYSSTSAKPEKPDRSDVSNDESQCEENHVQYASGIVPDAEYGTVNEFSQNIVGIVVGVIIAVSVICCIIHFGPDIWNGFWGNVGEQLEELKYNFSL